MAITRVGSHTVNNSSTGVTSHSYSHTTTSDTDLLILVVHLEGGDTVSGTPTFNSNPFTLIDSGTAGNATDTRTYIYGQVSPGAATATVSISFGGTVDPSVSICVNYSGTETGDVSGATNVVSTVSNTSASSTAVFSSGGSANNALFVSVVGQGADMQPLSFNNGFTEIWDAETGTNNNNDFGHGGAELLSGLPSGVTCTFGSSDENSGVLIEIVAASAALPHEPPNSDLTLAGKASASLLQVGSGLGPAALSLIGKTPDPQVSSPGSRIEEPLKADLTWAGKAPTADSPGGKTKTPAFAALTLTDKGIAVIETIQDGPTPAPLTLASFAPTVLKEDVPTPDTAGLSLVGKAPTTVTPVVTQQVMGALTLSGATPVSLLNDIRRPGVATLSLTNKVGGTVQPVTNNANLAGLTLTATTPAFSVGINQAPAKADLALAGKAGDIFLGNVVQTPGKAALTWAGVAPSTSKGVRPRPAKIALSFVGKTPATVVDSINPIPGKATFSLVGKAPRKGQAVHPAAASLSYGLKLPAFENTHIFAPSKGALAVVGKAPIFESNNVEKLTKLARLSLIGKTMNEIDGTWVVQGEETDIWTIQSEESDIWSRAA